MGPPTIFCKRLPWNLWPVWSHVANWAAGGRGECRLTGLQLESLFRTHRAAGFLSVPDMPRRVPGEVGMSIEGHKHVLGQAGSASHFLKYPVWLVKLSSTGLGGSKVPSARVLLSVPGAYFHSRILLYKWHLNSTSFLHFFQFDNSDTKTFAKEKCKVKDSKEKKYTASLWRIGFSSFRPSWQCLIRRLRGRDPQWLPLWDSPGRDSRG